MWDGTAVNKPVIWVWCEGGIFLRMGLGNQSSPAQHADLRLYETERECTIQSTLEPIRMSMATPSVGRMAMSEKVADFSARAAKSGISEFEGSR